MPITPRQFQVRACQSVMREFESRRSVCLVAPTGAGKTVMGSAIVRAHYRRGLRTLFLAHRRELIQQSASKLREACGSGTVGVIMPGSPRTLSCPVQVASIQTLTSESGQLVRPAADLIVWDECVVGDTRIGDKAASEVVVGDNIPAFDHSTSEIVYGKVVHVFKKQYLGQIIVIRAGGRSLACTSEHPIWVEGKGYVEAKSVIQGDMLWLRGNVQRRYYVRSKTGDLLQEMPEPGELQDDEANKRGAKRSCVQENEGVKSNGGRRDQKEGLKCTEIDGTLPDCKRREREGARVDNIEVHEQRDPGGVPVYNFEVEGCHTFFANGILTHNCHHIRAEQWSQLIDADSCYASAKILGLTATPERKDGRALGDVFESLVVAAQHSELLHDGYLVPCRVYQPQRGLASNEVAVDPLKAYQELGNGTLCFGFASRIEQCEQLAQRFTEAGIASAVIEASTSKQDRSKRLEEFRRGKIRVLWNVYALTEGVDVPEAGSVIIARKMDHCGMYLQCCGRVLRPAPGKTQAIIIDLSGATLLHGFPTEDREYALEGDAIKRTTPEQLRTCPACGACSPAWRAACPECGFVPPQVEAPQLVIYDEQLREVFQGANTPADAQRREYLRLRGLGRSKGWNLYFVRKEYEKLFGRKPCIDDASAEEKTAEWLKLRALGAERGYKDGWAKVRFRDTFGEWPANSLIYSREEM